jgi:hypothetical protein
LKLSERAPRAGPADGEPFAVACERTTDVPNREFAFSRDICRQFI